MRGHIVHEDRVRLGVHHQIRVNLVVGEIPGALLRLGFVAHARPNVGVDDVCVPHRVLWQLNPPDPGLL